MKSGNILCAEHFPKEKEFYSYSKKAALSNEQTIPAVEFSHVSLTYNNAGAASFEGYIVSGDAGRDDRHYRRNGFREILDRKHDSEIL